MRSYNNPSHPDFRKYKHEYIISDAKRILEILWYKDIYHYSLFDVIKFWDKISEERCAGRLDVKEYDEKYILELFQQYCRRGILHYGRCI